MSCPHAPPKTKSVEGLTRTDSLYSETQNFEILLRNLINKKSRDSVIHVIALGFRPTTVRAVQSLSYEAAPQPGSGCRLKRKEEG